MANGHREIDAFWKLFWKEWGGGGSDEAIDTETGAVCAAIEILSRQVARVADALEAKAAK